MALLEIVEAGHGRVAGLQLEIDRVREALDRTDVVLGATDEALGKAESAIETGRRWAPYVAVAIGVAVLAVGALIVMRRRSRGADVADA